MTKFKKPVFAAAAALMMLITGCSGGGQSSAADIDGSAGSDMTNSDESEMTTMQQQTIPADEQYVKLIGRTASDNGIRWLALSASGVEFNFTGTSASVTVVGDNMVNSGAEKQPRFAVYVNDERVLDEQLDAAEKTYDFFSSSVEAQTNVKIIKLSEAQESTMGIKSITVTGSVPVPAQEKDLKIEFIGDSITCGYGVDDEDRDHHFSTQTEDATKAYAYKTAMALDADYSLVSYSGNGIISGYSDDGNKVTSQRVPDIYEKFAKSYGSYDLFNVSDIDWDFGLFVPDIIVINLGTNDASYTGNNKEKVLEYVDGYVQFLKTVRSHNEKAHIICSLGVMGDTLISGVKKAVSQYTEETGDDNVSTFRFTPQDGSTGYAADWHPTAATHDIAAAELVEEIKKFTE